MITAPVPLERSLDELYCRPGFLLRRAHQISVALFLEETAGLGLTTTQYGMMVVLRARGSLDQAGIARSVGIDRSTSGLVVSKLAILGYIECRVDPADKRSKIISLSEAGRAMLDAVAKSAQRTRDRALQALPAKDARNSCNCCTGLPVSSTRRPARRSVPRELAPSSGPTGDRKLGRQRPTAGSSAEIEETDHMTRRFIDLSITLDPDVITDPPFMRPTIDRKGHRDSMDEAARTFPGITAENMAGGEGFAASESIQLSTHNGTHLDAPWHYHPTMDGGKPAMTIDQVPLDWCFRPGVKLDFRHLPDGHVVTGAQVEAELQRIGYTLQPLDIVLVNTAAGAALGGPDFLSKGVGIGYEATMYLTTRGIRVTGTDAWSWDAPFSYTAKRVADTGDYSLVWEGHKAGRDIGYCHMEKLTNLDQLPDYGFTVSCFPAKVKAGSAGWTRAVAIFDEANALPASA